MLGESREPRRDMPTPDFGLSIDAWGRLVLSDADGRRHVGVEPVRAFPLTVAGHWIALVDEKGREVVMVEDLARLDPDVRRPPGAGAGQSGVRARPEENPQDHRGFDPVRVGSRDRPGGDEVHPRQRRSGPATGPQPVADHRRTRPALSDPRSRGPRPGEPKAPGTLPVRRGRAKARIGPSDGHHRLTGGNGAAATCVCSHRRQGAVPVLGPCRWSRGGT